MILIRRYSNRKLYDTTSKKYVKLVDISKLVKSGMEVQIVSHPDGEDITETILSQIILDHEKEDGYVLPKNVLTRIIEAGDSAWFSFQKAWNAFLEPGKMFEEELRFRVNILLDESILTTEEADKITVHLLDERFIIPDPVDDKDMMEDSIPLSDLEHLSHQLEILEKELKSFSNSD